MCNDELNLQLSLPFEQGKGKKKKAIKATETQKESFIEITKSGKSQSEKNDHIRAFPT